jgi:hypothetical protein
MRNVVLAVAALGLAGLALPGSVPGQAQSDGDSSFGAGHVLETDFVGSGRSGPNGEHPEGTLTLSGYLNFTATLTCGNAEGNAVVAGYRIETGRQAGRGFLTSSVDNGRPRNGRPVDVTVYSGYLPRPPVDCPSPGDPPPRGFRSTGGGPFTSGDFTLTNVDERLPDGTPAARIEGVRLALRPRRLSGHSFGSLALRVRLCGVPGTALLRFAQATSPTGHDRPAGVRTEWEDQLRQEQACETHVVTWALTPYPSGRRYRVTLSARTTGRDWSRTVVRRVEAR